MATTTHRLTYDDLASIPQERPGDRHELIDGELFVTPSPISVHQIISANIFRRLDRYVDEEGLGRVFYAPIDFRFTLDNVLIPDLVYIAWNRMDIMGGQTVDAPPDLVIEILSPGTRRRDLCLKREVYARFKVPEYWIVDPREHSVTVLALASDRYEPVPPARAGVVSSLILPGLRLTLDAVFLNVP